MNFEDLMRSYKREVRSLPRNARDESFDIRAALSVFDSIFKRGTSGGYSVSEVGQRARRLKVEVDINNVKDFIKKSNRLFAADRELSAGGWGNTTASQLIALTNKLKTPGIARREELEERYGKRGAQLVLRHEGLKKRNEDWYSKIRAYTEYKKTHYDNLVDTYGSSAGMVLEREIRDDEESILNPEDFRKRKIRERFGSAGADRIFAAEREAMYKKGQATANAARADKDFAYWHDVEASDYDRKIFDLNRMYGAGRGEEAYRKMLMKEFPTFFKNSRLSTKDMHRMADGLRSVQKIPLIGRAITNPISAAIATASIADAFLNKSDKANEKVVDWENAHLLYGEPSKEFERAAYKAGFTNPGEIAEKYGKLSLKYGNPEAFLSMIFERTKNADPRARTKMAEDLGLDPRLFAIGGLMSGGVNESRARKINAAKSMVSVKEEIGWSSSGDFGDTMSALWWMIPGMKSSQARDIADSSWVEKSFQDGFDKTMDAAVRDYSFSNTKDYRQYERNTTIGDTVIENNITVNSGESTETVVSGATRGSIEAVRRTNNIDYISPGVDQ